MAKLQQLTACPLYLAGKLLTDQNQYHIGGGPPFKSLTAEFSRNSPIYYGLTGISPAGFTQLNGVKRLSGYSPCYWRCIQLSSSDGSALILMGCSIQQATSAGLSESAEIFLADLTWTHGCNLQCNIMAKRLKLSVRQQRSSRKFQLDNRSNTAPAWIISFNQPLPQMRDQPFAAFSYSCYKAVSSFS